MTGSLGCVCNVELKDALEFLDKHCCNTIKILLQVVLAPLARSVWTSFPGPGLTGWQNWFTIQSTVHRCMRHETAKFLGVSWASAKFAGMEEALVAVCFRCRRRLKGFEFKVAVWSARLSGVPVHWLPTCKRDLKLIWIFVMGDKPTKSVCSSQKSKSRISSPSVSLDSVAAE